MPLKSEKNINVEKNVSVDSRLNTTQVSGIPYLHTTISLVCPVSDYDSGIWGFSEQLNCNTHYRAIHSFLGIHKFTPDLAISCDIGWELGTKPKLQTYCLMKNKYSLELNVKQHLPKNQRHPRAQVDHNCL